MKAIHNYVCRAMKAISAVFDMSKIKNESNSQRRVRYVRINRGCI